MKRLKWVFNWQMIYGAVLGSVILGALGMIRSAWYYKGTGYVTYEQPDRSVKVSESQYKRQNYKVGGFLLAIGMGLWVVAAKSARDEANSRHTQEQVGEDS